MWIFDEMRNKMAAHVEECTIESPKFDKRGYQILTYLFKYKKRFSRGTKMLPCRV